MALSSTYQCCPLTKVNEIRLLDIHAGSVGDPVSVSLRVVNLSDSPDYEALSYVWGDATITKGILCDGRRVQVTVNLYDALSQLRLADRTRTLWADALCINQSDLDEKSRQIQIMHLIYQSCRRCVVWLGLPDEDSDAGLEMTRLMAEIVCKKLDIALEQLDSHLKATGRHMTQASEIGWSPLLPPKESPKWVSLFALLCRPWFTRVWVIQEAFFSADLLFYCGDRTCLYSELYYAADWIFWNANPITYAHKIATIGQYFSTRCNVMRLRQDPETQQYQRLADLLNGFNGFHATDPRDKVYALMHLPAFRRGYPDIMPDYRLSTEAIYSDVAYKVLERSRDLLLLTMVDRNDKNPALTLHLPSWVPRWHCPGTGHRTSNSYQFMSTSGKTEKAKQLYSIRLLASSDPTPYHSQATAFLSSFLHYLLPSVFSPRPVLPLPVLGITGFSFDVVHDVCELEFWGRRVPGEPRIPLFRTRTGAWERYRPRKADGAASPPPPSSSPSLPLVSSLERCPYTTEPGVVDAYAMTLTGSCRADDRGVLTSRCDASNYAHHMADFVAFLTWTRKLRREEEGAGGDGSGAVVVPNPLPPGDFYPPGLYAAERPTLTDASTEEIAKMSLRYSIMVCSYNFGRCLFRTRRGYIGTGPHDVQRGDVVCVLMGGAVPFILRPRENLDGHILIGDAYVHGIMDGELVKDWEEGNADLELQEFHIY